MVTPNTGSWKKVHFCVATALILCSLGARAAELSIPMDKVQQQLADKAEQLVSRKLVECREQEKGRKAPRYPVRIAQEQEPVQGIPLVFGGAEWAAP